MATAEIILTIDIIITAYLYVDVITAQMFQGRSPSSLGTKLLLFKYINEDNIYLIRHSQGC